MISLCSFSIVCTVALRPLKMQHKQRLLAIDTVRLDGDDDPSSFTLVFEKGRFVDPSAVVDGGDDDDVTIMGARLIGLAVDEDPSQTTISL